jgi:hypothetical protein
MSGFKPWNMICIDMGMNLDCDYMLSSCKREARHRERKVAAIEGCVLPANISVKYVAILQRFTFDELRTLSSVCHQPQIVSLLWCQR